MARRKKRSSDDDDDDDDDDDEEDEEDVDGDGDAKMSDGKKRKHKEKKAKKAKKHSKKHKSSRKKKHSDSDDDEDDSDVGSDDAASESGSDREEGQVEDGDDIDELLYQAVTGEGGTGSSSKGKDGDSEEEKRLRKLYEETVDEFDERGFRLVGYEKDFEELSRKTDLDRETELYERQLKQRAITETRAAIQQEFLKKFGRRIGDDGADGAASVRSSSRTKAGTTAKEKQRRALEQMKSQRQNKGDRSARFRNFEEEEESAAAAAARDDENDSENDNDAAARRVKRRQQQQQQQKQQRARDYEQAFRDRDREADEEDRRRLKEEGAFMSLAERVVVMNRIKQREADQKARRKLPHEYEDSQLPMTYEDVYAITLPRNYFEKNVLEPNLADTVKGCFVYVVIGANNGVTVRRLAVIVELLEDGKPYDLPPHSGVTKYLRLAIGGVANKRPTSLRLVSNEPVPKKEVERYFATCAQVKAEPPRKEEFYRKTADLQDAENRVVTAKDVVEEIERKRSAGKLRVGSLYTERNRLTDLLNVERQALAANIFQREENARHKGDEVLPFPAADSFDTRANAERSAQVLRELDAVNARIKDREDRERSADKFDKINRRTVEVKPEAGVGGAVDVAGAAAAASEYDPFSRRVTNPKRFTLPGTAPLTSTASASAASAAAAGTPAAAAVASGKTVVVDGVNYNLNEAGWARPAMASGVPYEWVFPDETDEERIREWVRLESAQFDLGVLAGSVSPFAKLGERERRELGARGIDLTMFDEPDLEAAGITPDAFLAVAFKDDAAQRLREREKKAARIRARMSRSVADILKLSGGQIQNKLSVKEYMANMMAQHQDK